MCVRVLQVLRFNDFCLRETAMKINNDKRQPLCRRRTPTRRSVRQQQNVPGDRCHIHTCAHKILVLRLHATWVVGRRVGSERAANARLCKRRRRKNRKKQQTQWVRAMLLVQQQQTNEAENSIQSKTKANCNVKAKSKKQKTENKTTTKWVWVCGQCKNKIVARSK